MEAIYSSARSRVEAASMIVDSIANAAVVLTLIQFLIACAAKIATRIGNA